MDDLTTYVFLATSFFFVAVALGLLVRYRQVSQRINASTDLGRDLWSALEQRLNKQDERILDVMGRLEVVQARVLSAASIVAPPPPTGLSPAPSSAPPRAPAETGAVSVTEAKPPVQQAESRGSQLSQGPPETAGPHGSLDETQMSALRLLAENPRNTRQLTDALKVSREHMARVMKALFESGLVSRDASSKPFVYQLTENGRSRLLPGRPANDSAA